jgi:hypothetical protein
MIDRKKESYDKQMFTADSWRVFRIVSEFVDGFETMMDIGASVSIFGSSRLTSESPYYQMAVEVSQEIAKRGFAIITGGGPGLMEAANKGAQNVQGKSCGLAIDVPHETGSNGFIDPKYRIKFRYFFVRKVMFIRYAQGFVFLPGGLGTLDELFEALTLIQTKKIHPFPIYLMGKEYWAGMLEWLEKVSVPNKCLTSEDLSLIHVTDDPEVVANGIERNYQSNRSIYNF